MSTRRHNSTNIMPTVKGTTEKSRRLVKITRQPMRPPLRSQNYLSSSLTCIVSKSEAGRHIFNLSSSKLKRHKTLVLFYLIFSNSSSHKTVRNADVTIYENARKMLQLEKLNLGNYGLQMRFHQIRPKIETCAHVHPYCNAPFSRCERCN